MSQQPDPQAQARFNQAFFNAVVAQRNTLQNEVAQKDAVLALQQEELTEAHARIAELTKLAQDNGLSVSDTPGEKPAV